MRYEEKTAAMPQGVTPTRFTILVVDDEAYIFDLLADTFAEDYELIHAMEGLSALELAISRLPDLILLDVLLPGLDGYKVCDHLKGLPQTKNIPVIFLTGASDRDAETKGLQRGASDFISKPINCAALKARVTNHMNLRRAQDQVMRAATEKFLAGIAAEVERSAAKDRARTLELDMKDRFLTHVSHELRAPLTAIYLFVSLIADRLAGPTTAQQDEYLVRTMDNVEQMKSMVDDLLDTARIRNGRVNLALRPVVVAEALDYAIQTLGKSAAGKMLTLSTKISESLSPGYADVGRLKQILVILLENAVKFTAPEGKIVIVVSTFPDDSNFLLIEMSDTGCGIDPEACEQIFDRLYQADSSDEGRMSLGLGLHIAKELVTLHGGSIWVESIVEKGSTFRFTVPVYAGQAVSAVALDDLDP